MAYTVAQLTSLYRSANPGAEPDLAAIMAAIAYAESTGKPTAVNKSGATGLWQIMPSVWMKDAGFKAKFGSKNLKDATVNAQAAEYVRRKQGFSAWTTYNNKEYLKHYDWTATSSAVAPVGGATSDQSWLAKVNSALLKGPTAAALAVGIGAKETADTLQDVGITTPMDFLKALPGLWFRAGKIYAVALLGVLLVILGVVILLAGSKTVQTTAKVAVKAL